ncbi:MAG TPA: cytochrome P450, partial [Solirubrobacteraceae bacterium]|nr:cytochrome P450 [Solirubrobacteraceae bacterium]
MSTRGRYQGGSGVALPPGSSLPAPAQTLSFWAHPTAHLDRARARYGERFTIRATGHLPLVFLSDPEEVAAALRAPEDALSPGRGGSAVMPIVGERSFMLQEGELHNIGRRATLAAFRARTVREHGESTLAEVEREVAAWPLDAPLALHPRLRTLTLGVALRKIFGDGVPEERLLLLRERILAMLTITTSAMLTVEMLRRGPGARKWTRFLREREQVDELLHALIDERLRASEEAGMGVEHEDALGRFLTARKPDGSRLSREELHDNVMSIVLAGHETTAAELAWAFQLLAHNPSAQARLAVEIDRDGGDEYLTATAQEALRHRCAFLFAIPREVLRPGVRIGEWTYDPPAQLLGCIYLVHHDPALYPEPERFLPERFLESPPRPEHWIPWGGGRKRCPGLHMALFETKAVIREVLARTLVEPAARHME